MLERYEMRFAGSGGQGMMLISDIMAEAAGIDAGREVLVSKSYGPEARGGACRSEMIVSDRSISYPVVTSPNFMLAMSQLSVYTYAKDLAKGGVMLVDSGLVENVPEVDGTVYKLPITEIAVNTVQKALNANIVALGVISVLVDYVDTDDVRRRILERFTEKFSAANEAAFNAGVEAGKSLIG